MDGGKARVVLECGDVRLWSAETPEMYKIGVGLMEAGRECHARSIEFGFRKVERRRELLLINGMPLKLRGINYHAFTSEGGYICHIERRVT